MLTKQEKIEKIIYVLEQRNLIIESTEYKHQIKQLTDEKIDKLYDLILEYEKEYK